MHQAIACALVATPALACITTLPHKVKIVLSCSLSLILASAGPGKTLVKPSANISFVPIHFTVTSSSSTYSRTLQCRTRMCFDRSLEIGFTANKLALLLSPHNVGFCDVRLKSVHTCLAHISSFVVLLIATSSASVVSPAMISCRLDLQNTQFPYIRTTIPETLLILTLLAKSASENTSTTSLPLEGQADITCTLQVSHNILESQPMLLGTPGQDMSSKCQVRSRHHSDVVDAPYCLHEALVF